MISKSEPWYIHAVLYVIIAVLTVVLIWVAILQPQEVVEKEKYFKNESRARMSNLREAQILFQKKYGRYTSSVDSLITFLKNEKVVVDLMTKPDSITGKIKNPFKDLTVGPFNPNMAESLRFSPKSYHAYKIAIDSNEVADTVIDRSGRVVRVNKHISKGNRYVIECPDNYGKIGDLFSDALKNTASWE
ncbi:MAG TPA: hypothetical protein PL041_06290 [Melioribacteraceae bacterium]|nr:hypothetical protein [Melioribacteraceae bacterium]